MNKLIDSASSATLIQSSRHACAITYKNRILCIGTSKKKTHPLQEKFKSRKERVYLHAEIDAIVKCINLHGTEILKDCEMHVLRVTGGGNIGFSKPCPGCQKAIDAFNIKKVYHT